MLHQTQEHVCVCVLHSSIGVAGCAVRCFFFLFLRGEFSFFPFPGGGATTSLSVFFFELCFGYELTESELLSLNTNRFLTYTAV